MTTTTSFSGSMALKGSLILGPQVSGSVDTPATGCTLFYDSETKSLKAKSVSGVTPLDGSAAPPNPVIASPSYVLNQDTKQPFVVTKSAVGVLIGNTISSLFEIPIPSSKTIGIVEIKAHVSNDDCTKAFFVHTYARVDGVSIVEYGRICGHDQFKVVFKGDQLQLQFDAGADPSEKLNYSYTYSILFNKPIAWVPK